jgi:RpiR family carbohydrate utilization transcriptional regulator
MSIGELSTSAGVSAPTVLRFARRLGFAGYKEFRQKLADEVSGEASLSVSTRTASDEDIFNGQPGFFHRTVEAYVSDFTKIVSTVDEEKFVEAVNALSTASRIEFWGQCTSSTLAMDAYDKFFRAGIPCDVTTEPDQQKLYGRDFDTSSVVVAISHYGQNESLARSISQADELGVKVVGITMEDSPVARAATIALVTHRTDSNALSEMNLKTAQMFLVDALAVATVANRKEEEGVQEAPDAQD